MIKEFVKKNRLLVSGVLLLLGSFYVGFPHSVHQKYALDWLIGLNFPHFVHVIEGIILLVWGYSIYKEKWP